MALGTKDTTLSLIRDYGGTILVATVVALVIRFFFVEAYRIPSSAMRPTLEPGDTIFVAKWPFGLRLPGFNSAFTAGRQPVRGEIVVYSLALPDDSRRDYIKRVIGLPGDNVAVKGGRVFINGLPVEIPQSEKANCASEKTLDGISYPVCFESPVIEDFGPETIPQGSVFLLGDLRKKTPRQPGTENPIRSWGIQPISALRGHALWIWLSVEPQNTGVSSGLFPSLRIDRMFRRIQ